MLCLTYNQNSLLRRSRCDNCHQKLNFKDLMPVLSYVVHLGKCQYCHQSIGSKYILAEILTGLFLVLLSHHYPIGIAMTCLIGIFLIPIAIYDIDYFEIPNFMLLMLFICLFIVNILHQHFEVNVTVILYKLLFIILLHLFFFLTKSIGYGDIKLFTIILLFVPLPFFIALFFITYLIGGVASMIFLSYKRDLKQLPLVPFISASYIVVLLLYEPIKKLYFGGFI